MGIGNVKRTAPMLFGVGALAVLAGWWFWPRQTAGGEGRRAGAGAEDEVGHADRAGAAHASRGLAGTPRTSRQRATAASAGSQADIDGITLPPGPYRPPSPDDCDDGDPCTRQDRLTGNDCRGVPFSCDDGNPLTTNECTGQGCLFRPKPGVTRPAIEG
ncbi:MAG: hypothetical protein HY905_15660 [Deltaproteobacteria bacterium]|nr:hypothetical protein [Deltaproteobacteria bacterium]